MTRHAHRLPRWQRRSLYVAGAALLALTGYLLYYFASESVRPALGWLHSAVGIAAGAGLAFHQRRKSRETRMN